MNGQSSSPGDSPEGIIEINLFGDLNKVGKLRTVMIEHFGATEEDRIKLFGNNFPYHSMRKFLIGKREGVSILDIVMANDAVWSVTRSEGKLTLQNTVK